MNTSFFSKELMKFGSCDYALGARRANLEQCLPGLMCPGFDVLGGHFLCPSQSATTMDWLFPSRTNNLCGDLIIQSKLSFSIFSRLLCFHCTQLISSVSQFSLIQEQSQSCSIHTWRRFHACVRKQSHRWNNVKCSTQQTGEWTNFKGDMKH